jgi:outer membrane lipoprotein carrier protein
MTDSHFPAHFPADFTARFQARRRGRFLAAFLAGSLGGLRPRHLAGYLFAAGFVLAGLLGATASQPVLAADAIEQLKAFSRTTQSARGEFTQQLVKQSRQASPPAKGEFAFARPGRFRWDIQSPYQQLIVTDGKKLYFYDKDLKQVTIREAGDVISATPAAVLFGGADLDSAFTLKDEGERDGLQWVEAVPKAADSGFDRIRIGMRDGLPAEMEVKDAFGQVNRFTFTRISRNAAVADSEFSFTPPAGVDVIQ